MRIWVYKRRWWWSAINPDEALGTVDTPTYIRSRSREGVIEKAKRRWGPRPVEYEEINLDEDSG